MKKALIYLKGKSSCGNIHTYELVVKTIGPGSKEVFNSQDMTEVTYDEDNIKLVGAASEREYDVAMHHIAEYIMHTQKDNQK